MGSSGYRAGILTDWFTDLGVGLVFDTTQGAPYYAYWTQNFASGDTVPLPSALWLFLSGIALLRLSGKTLTTQPPPEYSKLNMNPIILDHPLSLTLRLEHDPKRFQAPCLFSDNDRLGLHN